MDFVLQIASININLLINFSNNKNIKTNERQTGKNNVQSNRLYDYLVDYLYTNIPLDMKNALILCLILLMSCKKQTTKPIDYSGQYKSGKVTVTINSNYKYPYVRIEANNAYYKRMNWAGLSDSTEIVYEFNSYLAEWRIYSSASKNGLDSTKHMKDGNVLWSSLKIETGGQIIFYSSDTIHPGTGQHGVSNDFTFLVY